MGGQSANKLFPDEFSYNKLEKMPQKEVIPFVLQKRDVPYLLYWWLFFMREHVKPMHDVIDQRYRKKYGSPIRDPEYDDYPEDEDSDFPEGEDGCSWDDE
ncbi:hypothetical protein RvY_19263 [Ramazzottius varieornatus]|uniref:Uncharacterized protein n=1 Tax=Ramazzottius varieornatus TaxID=947166 RepID=A0A1D1WAT8_RAMVA|nr:hypothetical protein RvY_19263 [Ramazzottius varieornatus]